MRLTRTQILNYYNKQETEIGSLVQLLIFNVKVQTLKYTFVVQKH